MESKEQSWGYILSSIGFLIILMLNYYRDPVLMYFTFAILPITIIISELFKTKNLKNKNLYLVIVVSLLSILAITIFITFLPMINQTDIIVNCLLTISIVVIMIMYIRDMLKNYF
ncbi:MAG: hypothetical protein Q8M06_03790 [Methanobacteriaceae archaeon]|nr:hypothetical protein [Methanobacteriaceae archaeon]MDZ4171224.1 hypothetical protein [Methanobacteriaceae archaeon]